MVTSPFIYMNNLIIASFRSNLTDVLPISERGEKATGIAKDWIYHTMPREEQKYPYIVIQPSGISSIKPASLDEGNTTINKTYTQLFSGDDTTREFTLMHNAYFVTDVEYPIGTTLRNHDEWYVKTDTGGNSVLVIRTAPVSGSENIQVNYISTTEEDIYYIYVADLVFNITLHMSINKSITIDSSSRKNTELQAALNDYIVTTFQSIIKEELYNDDSVEEISDMTLTAQTFDSAIGRFSSNLAFTVEAKIYSKESTVLAVYNIANFDLKKWVQMTTTSYYDDPTKIDEEETYS